MKIEHLIVQYLYTNKKVTLQDIGTFYLSSDVTIPTEHDKDAGLPDNAITFEYNIKAVQDEGLIDFIVQQTRKIKPLATSDLESFTILGRQFINIGKPLPIEGLGILQKNQHGEYEFIQGHTMSTKHEPSPTVLKEKNREEIDFSTPARKQNSKAGTFAVVIVFLLLAASAAFYFVFKNNKDKKTDQLVIQKTDEPVAKIDSSLKTALINDSLSKAAQKTDSTAFKVVIRQYTSQATSDYVYQKFLTYGHKKMIQYAPDTSHFRLAYAFKNPLSDTTRIKDSLRVLFGNKGGVPFIDRN